MSTTSEDWNSDEDDALHDDEPAEEPPTFRLLARDRKIIHAAKQLAWKMVRAPGIQRRDLVGLQRAIYALKRLPSPTKGVSVEFGVKTPIETNKRMEITRFWTVRVTRSEIEMYSGGFLDIGNGGDSFRTASWSAELDCVSEYNPFGQANQIERFGNLPDRIPGFATWPKEIDRMDLSSGYFTLEIEDKSRGMDTDLNVTDEVDEPSKGDGEDDELDEEDVDPEIMDAFMRWLGVK